MLRADTVSPPLLEARNVFVRYRRRHAFARLSWVDAVKDVSFSVSAGRTLGIVGESGSGKSTLAWTVCGLTRLHAGELRWQGRPFDPSARNGEGSGVAVVFQDPMGSLDPRWPLWRLVTERLAIARGAQSRTALRKVAAESLAGVHLPPELVDRLPHELSGGQRQRVALARALIGNPKLLVLDEPTSALDVSVQARMLDLLVELQRERALAFLLVSHDIAVIRHMADDILVLRGGSMVEHGPSQKVLSAPRHAYTRSLLAAEPRLETFPSAFCPIPADAR